MAAGLQKHAVAEGDDATATLMALAFAAASVAKNSNITCSGLTVVVAECAHAVGISHGQAPPHQQAAEAQPNLMPVPPGLPDLKVVVIDSAAGDPVLVARPLAPMEAAEAPMRLNAIADVLEKHVHTLRAAGVRHTQGQA